MDVETDNKRGMRSEANCMKYSEGERQKKEKKMGDKCTRWWKEGFESGGKLKPGSVKS